MHMIRSGTVHKRMISRANVFLAKFNTVLNIVVVDRDTNTSGHCHRTHTLVLIKKALRHLNLLDGFRAAGS